MALSVFNELIFIDFFVQRTDMLVVFYTIEFQQIILLPYFVTIDNLKFIPAKVNYFRAITIL